MRSFLSNRFAREIRHLRQDARTTLHGGLSDKDRRSIAELLLGARLTYLACSLPTYLIFGFAGTMLHDIGRPHAEAPEKR